MKKKVDDKLFEKIQKLFALSRSPNVNEAAAALKKAKILMNEYDLSYGQVSFIEKEHNNDGIKCYRWEENIFYAVCFANNCVGANNRGEGLYCITGRKINVFLTQEMFKYLIDTIKRIAKEKCLKKGHKFNHDFKMAASLTLKDKIYTYADQVSWAVDRKQEIKDIEEYQKKYIDRKNKKIENIFITEAYMAGTAAAKNISLHKQSGIEKTQLIGAIK